jgi:hypothetical protein
MHVAQAQTEGDCGSAVQASVMDPVTEVVSLGKSAVLKFRSPWFLLASTLALLTVTSWERDWGGQPSAALSRLLTYLGAGDAYVVQVGDWLNDDHRRDGIVHVLTFLLVVLGVGVCVHVAVCLRDGEPVPEDISDFVRRMASTTASAWIVIAVLAECHAISAPGAMLGLGIAAGVCLWASVLVVPQFDYGIGAVAPGALVALILLCVWLVAVPFVAPLVVLATLAGFREALIRD